jgi:hypothetical protein
MVYPRLTYNPLRGASYLITRKYPNLHYNPLQRVSFNIVTTKYPLQKAAQELVDSGLVGVDLAKAIWDMWKTYPEDVRREFLEQTVTATVWHGTRRREPIEDLKKYGFCSYTQEQALRWLNEAHRRLVEKTKAGPRVTKHLEKWKEMIHSKVLEPSRGYFSVTGIEETACGEAPCPFTGRPGQENLLSGWADRNPEFVYDYLYIRATPQELDKFLTEMFGKPLKVKLRIKLQLEQLLNPTDIHTKQRCFKPEEIIDITPCPPKTAKQLRAEIDRLWTP